jgi:YVTN family beta-propeller protein
MDSVFRILGPLEVARDAHPVSLGARRERAILAILLLHSGDVVSVERLIDGVWGDARPTSAKHMVHEYVSKLRQTLQGMASISTRPPGYLLEPGDTVLDVREFEQITAAARDATRESRHHDALGSYDRALALWRGDTLADVPLEGQAHTAATRLDQERRLVDEERIDCALALGQHLRLIAELEHRVVEAPLRERSRAQLMLALYRAGRQTEALDRYREGRALLVEHAGVEPGPDLRQLERAILTQDPALEVVPSELPQGRPATTVRGRHGRRGRAVAALALLALVAGALAFFIVGRSGSAGAIGKLASNSAGAIDPGTNRLVAQVPVGAGASKIASGFGSLWVVNGLDNSVSRIDPRTGTEQRRISVDADPTGIAAGSGFVWVASTGTRHVDRIDPQLDRVTQRTPVGNGPSAVAISPGAVWVTNRLDDTVTMIDSKTGARLRTLNAGSSPSDIAYGLGALWIANESSSTVTRLDPRTGALLLISVGNGPEAIAIGAGSVWVANGLDGSISRIDPARNRIVSVIHVGAGPSAVLSSGGAIWVAASYGGRIVRVDPARNVVAEHIDVGSAPQGLAAISGRIWLSARETATAHRGGTLRVYILNTPDTLDPAADYGTAWPALASTSDGLVGFKRVGGLDGFSLVPDLATGLPAPTDGGRTYTFQLRRGIRYSNGEPVRASDLRRALERVFRIGNPGQGFYRGLVGGESCSKARCDLSRGVVADDRTGIVILHLRRPDPELFDKLALPSAYPVPRGTSLTHAEPLGVRGTGPYRILSYAQHRLVLVRNQHFREWSAAAQPAGYPDRIVLTFSGALDKQLSEIEQGTADFMESPLPAKRLTEVMTRFAAQVHVFPLSATFSVFLNTREPPFDSLAARQAFSLALDRSKAIPGFGGSEGAAVTCQMIPAGMPGYRPYCPFTRNPTRNGVWTGPDLARARKLVAASGTRGQKVVMWTGTKPLQLVVGKLALATLQQLGYRASLKIRADYWDKANDSRSGIQAGFYAWTQDFPTASNFLLPFTCRAFRPANPDNFNLAEICDPRIDRAVGRALARQGNDPRAASTAWAAADRQITDLVPWAPIVNWRNEVVVSRRVGNVQANPQWGVLIDQMWVR